MYSREVLKKFITTRSCVEVSCMDCPFGSITSGCSEAGESNFTEETYSKVLNIYIKDYGEVELYKLLMEIDCYDY